MKFFLFICLFFSSIFLSAQVSVEGYWAGTITHNEGGYRSEYRLELFLKQDSTQITGRSFVYVDSIYAEMDIAGELHSGIYLQIKDLEILEHLELQGMEWCIKTYQLLLKQNGDVLKLEGHWQGKTSFSTCVPGRIFLKKTKPRA